MTDSPLGWYVDPSGLPDTFRWWDGRQWTQALTTDPTAPAPVDPEPVIPPGEQPTEPSPQPSESPTVGPTPPTPAGPPYARPPYPPQPYGHQPPSTPVPPPPGAPGPGYVPPPFDPVGGRTEVLAAGPEGPIPDDSRRRRGLLIGGVGGAVLLVLVLIGGYLVFFSDDDTEPTASDEPGLNTPPPTRTPVPPPTPPETPPTDPNQTPPPEPQPTKRLEYQQLPRPWSLNKNVTEATFGGGTGAFGQARVTEEDYRDTTDWVAMVGAGPARPEWIAGQGDLEATADQAAQWFADNSFGDGKVERGPAATEPLEVSGQEGVLLKEHVSYDIQNLQAKGETVYVAVVDLGEGNPPGVFVASVPDTHQKLLDDIDQAVASLRVTG